jgi:hypothetical protein
VRGVNQTAITSHLSWCIIMAGLNAPTNPMTGKLMPGIHHSAICTADLDRSMKFWRDGLGFTQLHVKQSRSLQVSLV